MSVQDQKLVRWGILGCGDVTEKKSGPALQKTERSELCCVMRRDPDKAADYAKRHGVANWTADADALIQNPDLTAIYIATPPHTHADYAIRAMRAGKDVLVEKPMALTPQECRTMEAIAKETGRKLCVAYYRRALPRFEKLRQIAKDGTIGALRMIEVRQLMRAEDGPGHHWKTDPAINGGGLFVDMQSHTLDWLTYLFGTPASVAGLTKTQGQNTKAEDLVTFMLDYGAFPAIGLCAYASGENEERVTLHGEKGVASMRFFAPSPISLTIEGTEQLIELEDPQHVHQPFIERVVAHFLDSAPNPCSPAEGIRVSELTEAILKGTH
ncbi:Predicted dehydrogenase [Cohaesibacter marisflavi]|uniref:Predicted dehydrogenase n=1 Tax=Cohaesibacter marisflavi TaxID=655353 RepID=A0A1I5H3K4_9HYPH|nr:Gfo/Idh/MocA family oxidoreductase [Cohaesibacter marisflavi]SFO42787.1 Predicted dehydrogenase [Cohaesibacter marisflavi]